MNKQTASTLLALITILLVFAVVQPLVPFNVQHFSELGVLGPDQQVGGYPTNITIGHSILLYGYVGNHEGSVQFYQVLAKLGNQSTQVSNTTSASAPVLFSYSVIIDQNQTYVFPINLTINNVGNNQKLIFELWDYNSTIQQFTYTGLWNQLFVSVTSA